MNSASMNIVLFCCWAAVDRIGAFGLVPQWVSIAISIAIAVIIVLRLNGLRLLWWRGHER